MYDVCIVVCHFIKCGFAQCDQDTQFFVLCIWGSLDYLRKLNIISESLISSSLKPNQRATGRIIICKICRKGSDA